MHTPHLVPAETRDESTLTSEHPTSLPVTSQKRQCVTEEFSVDCVESIGYLRIVKCVCVFECLSKCLDTFNFGIHLTLEYLMKDIQNMSLKTCLNNGAI